MFCPKCRQNRLHNDVESKGWFSFKTKSAAHCVECGMLLCSDRMASEFDADSYAPRAAVHGHKLDGLLSVSRLLTETKASTYSAAWDSNTQTHFDGPGRSMRSTLIMKASDYPTETVEPQAERIGRYDQRPPLDDIGYNSQPVQVSSQSGSKPSPWPVIAIVLALEIIVSIGVYTNKSKAPVEHAAIRGVAIHSQVSAQRLAPNGTSYQTAFVQQAAKLQAATVSSDTNMSGVRHNPLVH